MPLYLDIHKHVEGLTEDAVAGAHAKERFLNAQIACRRYAHEHGIDEESITGWRWPF